MKILVVSDIHGNLPALEAVMGSISDIDLLLCAGDLAGYFPFVNEVVDILSTYPNCICVMGNHDAALLNPLLTTNSFSADLALTMQRKIISTKNHDFLASLPLFRELQINNRIIKLFHGSPTDYLNGRDKYWESDSLPSGIYINGHTHIPYYYENQTSNYTIINPGGTGFPRDKNPQTSYAVIDTCGWKVTFHRLSYDIDRLTKMCSAVGLPPHFIRSIEMGTWVHYNEI